MKDRSRIKIKIRIKIRKKINRGREGYREFSAFAGRGLNPLVANVFPMAFPG
jgi:hypothetical protein